MEWFLPGKPARRSGDDRLLTGPFLDYAMPRAEDVCDWPDDDELARKAKTMGEGRNLSLFFDYFSNKLSAAQEIGDPNLPTERRAAN